jgi:hypothetical protein
MGICHTKEQEQKEQDELKEKLKKQKEEDEKRLEQIEQKEKEEWLICSQSTQTINSTHTQIFGITKTLKDSEIQDIQCSIKDIDNVYTMNQTIIKLLCEKYNIAKYYHDLYVIDMKNSQTQRKLLMHKDPTEHEMLRLTRLNYDIFNKFGKHIQLAMYLADEKQIDMTDEHMDLLVRLLPSIDVLKNKSLYHKIKDRYLIEIYSIKFIQQLNEDGLQILSPIEKTLSMIK